MEFIDRVSAYPNRYVMTDENGNTSHIYLERADEPTVPGTPLNAENMNTLLQEPQLVYDMDAMTSLLGVVIAGTTKNIPTNNSGIALNRTFGSYQMQYIFLISTPGMIVARIKTDGVWSNWSKIKFGYTDATSEE